MDAKQFDALATSLAGQASRRAMAGGLAGGIFGTLLNLLGLPSTEAAKRRKTRNASARHRRNDQAAAAKKKKKKNVTLCHDGQTIKVNKKKKKKYLQQGDTLGACPTPTPPSPPSPPPPPCTPNPNPCAGRQCGSVDNGCGTQVSCGTCAPPAICNTTTGQCGCTPNATACAGRECGTVDNGCGTQVPCGANNGGCAGTDFCQTSTGQCLPAACQSCTGCCDESSGTCPAGDQPGACGFDGAPCEACNPEVACVNGVCTCSQTSCAQGCCTTDANGRPFCDNTKRPCGNTCLPKEQCCTGVDSSNRQVWEGCLPNETCVVNAQGFGQCQCGGGGVCQRNQGCCTLVNGQPTCDTTLRPCSDICIPREQCCREGQVGCDDGVSCTTETCEPDTGTGVTLGICQETVLGVCTEACAAGEGYGNDFPENQREVVCRDALNGLRCYCWRTTEGDNVCTEDFFDAPPCRTSVDCASGRVCIRSGLTTGSNRCAPICQ